MSASYAHRLDPRTDANLTAAILAVGNLLGVSPIADGIIEHLKDRIGDTLSPEQRANPFSVYSGELLGRMAEYVKETFGIDKSANIHAAPQGPNAKETPIGSDSVFALDGLGRNRFEQLTGAPSGGYARMIAEVNASSAAYSAMTVWNPSSGAAGLNEFNFGGTPFAQNGLDLATTKHLYGQGFNQTQILNASHDMKALGFNPKDQEFAEGFAAQERLDPEGRGQRQRADRAWADWTKKNKDELNRLQAIVDGTAPGTPEHDAATADLKRLVQQGYIETGQAAVDERIATVTPAPGAEPEDRGTAATTQDRKRQDTFTTYGVNVDLVETLDASAARQLTSDAAVDAYQVAGAVDARTAEHAIEEAATEDFFAAAPEGAQPEPSSPSDTVPAAQAAGDQAPEPDDAPTDPSKPQKAAARVPPPAPGGIGHA